MKKILIILSIFLLPSTTFAFNIPWNATSTATDLVTPIPISGVVYRLWVPAILTTTPNAVNFLNGFLGVSTSSPSQRLSVQGNALISGDLSVANLTATGTVSFTGTGTSTFAGGVSAAGLSSSLGLTLTGGDLLYSAANFRVTSGGNVGIGTTTPSSILHVEGASPTFNLIASSGNPFFRMADSAGSATRKEFTITNDVTNNRVEFQAIQQGVASRPIVINPNGGNVGIGTVSPNYKLEVQGTASTTQLQLPNTDSSTTGGIYFGGTRAIHNYGTNNFFAGVGAGNLTFTGIGRNIGIGPSALDALTTGTENIGIGLNALGLNTEGTNNTAVGISAISTNTTGDYNVGIGYQALVLNTTGGFNTSVGSNSMLSNTTGEYNTVSGYASLYTNKTGSYNTVSGRNSLYNNTTGSFNVVNGASALYYNQSATSSTAFGYAAAQGTAAYYNQGGTYIGYAAGYNAATGSDYNTLIGFQSGYGVTTGARNVFLGNSTIAASYNQVTTGSNNISIGNNVAVASATASNQLNIGNLIYGTGLDGTGTTLSSGFIGIGTTSPLRELNVNASSNVTAADTTFYPLRLTSYDSAGSGFWNTQGSGLEFEIAGSWGSGVVADIIGRASAAAPQSNGDLMFRTNQSGTMTTALLINNSGKVGIGTTTPSKTLSVQGNGLFSGDVNVAGLTATSTITAANFVANSASATSTFAGGLAIETSGFVYDFSSGYVGIGTSAPTAPLYILKNSTSAERAIKIQNGETDGSYGYIQFSSSSALNDNYGSFIGGGRQGAGGTNFLLFGTGSGSPQERMRIDNSGNVGIGTTSPSSLLSVSGSTGVGFTNTGTGNSFYVEDSANDTTPFVIDGSGNVGIGTTSPQSKFTVYEGNLEVTNTISSTSKIKIRGNLAQLELFESDQTDLHTRIENNGGFLLFKTINNSGTGLYTRMAINHATGNVGIGTTTPSKTLSVQGDALISGNLNVAGITATSTITSLGTITGATLKATTQILYPNSVALVDSSNALYDGAGVAIADSAGNRYYSDNTLWSDISGNVFFPGGLDLFMADSVGNLYGNGSNLTNVNHSTLTNLSVDSHTQYTLLVGRSGGQTLYGGTAANDDITIQGTSNATKTTSYVNLQTTGGFVGIGTTTPISNLQVDSTTGTAQVTVSGRTTGGCIMLRDTDDAGWTECDALNGTLSCSLDLDGLCD